jgi:PAS domain-containing protein
LQENIAVETAIERVVKLLPEGWQYPEIAIARISHGDIRRQSPDFRETPWRMESTLACNDGTLLRVEVAYREARPATAKGPLLSEERQMLDDVAGMLKSFIGRLAAQHARNRLVSILESTSDLVASFNPDGRIFYLNEAGRCLFAIDTPEICIGIEAIYPSWALTQHRQMALPTAAREGFWKGEVTIRAAAGRELTMSQMLIAHHDDAGALSHYSLIAHHVDD